MLHRESQSSCKEIRAIPGAPSPCSFHRLRSPALQKSSPLHTRAAALALVPKAGHSLTMLYTYLLPLDFKAKCFVYGDKWERPYFSIKPKLHYHLENVVSGGQRIPWKQPPAKTWHQVLLCPKVVKAFMSEAWMRQTGSNIILEAVLQKGNVTVRHKLTLK